MCSEAYHDVAAEITKIFLHPLPLLAFQKMGTFSKAKQDITLECDPA